MRNRSARRGRSLFLQRKFSFVTSDVPIISTSVDDDQPKFLNVGLQVLDSRKMRFGPGRAISQCGEFKEEMSNPMESVICR